MTSQESKALCKNFARTHLRDCARELLEWDSTGGVVRQLAKLCHKCYDKYDDLFWAATIIKQVAIEEAAKLE